MFLKVRRQNHEEDVAYRGDSYLQPQQCWLLLLQLASPPGPGRCMPRAAASLQSMHNRAGHVWRASCAGSALRATAAMVIGKRFPTVAEVTRLRGRVVPFARNCAS